MKNMKLSAAIGCLVAGVALVGSSVPASAQETEEIIVSGRYGKLPESAQTASQSVSYGDLDLSREGDRKEFKRRLNLTARYLCEKLGETDSAAPPANSSCRQAAVKDAMARVGTIEEHWAPRDTAWVAGPRWTAPYPDSWTSDYPG